MMTNMSMSEAIAKQMNQQPSRPRPRPVDPADIPSTSQARPSPKENQPPMAMPTTIELKSGQQQALVEKGSTLLLC